MELLSLKQGVEAQELASAPFYSPSPYSDPHRLQQNLEFRIP